MSAKDYKFKNGGSKAEDRAQTRMRRGNTNTSGVVADWESVDGELLAKAVAAVSRLGGALRLGYTRDGGAYAIGIYGDGEPFTEYVPPAEDMNAWLKGMIDDYTK